MKSRLSILRRTILFTLIMGVALLFLCTQYSFASEENDAGMLCHNHSCTKALE